MADRRRRGRASVLFDDAAFELDLRRAGEAGRATAEPVREELERQGCATEWLLACAAEGPDGTELLDCVKVYLPRPRGRFGMVFRIERREGRLVLVYIAFGVRHPVRGARRPSVYRIAHDRLHGLAG